MVQKPKHVVIVGAGIGGLSSALRLAHAGLRVTVLERHAALFHQQRDRSMQVRRS